MKLAAFKRLIVEDFEEKDRPLVGKIAYAVNIAFEDIFNVMSKNLSVNDNLNLNKKDITVTVNGNGVPTSKTIVASGLASQCVGMSVIRAVNTANTSINPTGTPFINFTDNSGQITINNISNLQANQQYVLTIILWPS